MSRTLLKQSLKIQKTLHTMVARSSSSLTIPSDVLLEKYEYFKQETNTREIKGLGGETGDG